MADQVINGAPLWPLSPNWRSPYSVSYEYKTDIFTSRSGKEQRRAQRTTPRKVVKFTVTRTKADARTFSRFLTLYQGPLLALADSARFARIKAPIEPSGTVFPVDDASAQWLNGGASVALYFGGAYLAAQVKSVDRDANLVTLTAATGRAWPPGTKIHPILRGRLDNQVGVKNYHDRTIDADISFNIEPGVVQPDDTGSAFEVFNRREVFIFRPNMIQPVEGSYRRLIDQVDFGRGRIQTYLPVAFSTRTKQFQMLLPTQADRQALVGLFQRMKGQRGEFYMPSYEDDFTPLAGAADALTATFAGTLLDEVFQADDVHRAVVLFDANGNRFYRSITASSNDGVNTTLTTDIGWPANLVGGGITINWLLVHRFAVDMLSIDCITDEVGQAQLSVVSLEDLPVSDTDSIFDPPGLDGAAEWVLRNWGFAFFVSRIADPFDFLVNTAYPYDTRSIGVRGVNNAATGFDGLMSKYRKTFAGK